VTETRIRWDDDCAGDIPHYAGRAGTVDADLFKIWPPDGRDPEWLLTPELPGHDYAVYGDGLEELKGRAEELLAEFVASLGAVFPDGLREAVMSERDAHRMMAGEGHGDCPHSWSSHTSCGSARALDWVLDQMAAATAAAEDPR
jgi:hypothetical protein